MEFFTGLPVNTHTLNASFRVVGGHGQQRLLEELSIVAKQLRSWSCREQEQGAVPPDESSTEIGRNG